MFNLSRISSISVLESTWSELGLVMLGKDIRGESELERCLILALFFSLPGIKWTQEMRGKFNNHPSSGDKSQKHVGVCGTVVDWTLHGLSDPQRLFEVTY